MKSINIRAAKRGSIIGTAPDCSPYPETSTPSQFTSIAAAGSDIYKGLGKTRCHGLSPATLASKPSTTASKMRFSEVFTALTLAASAVAHPSAPKPKKGLATAMKARGREFIGTALTL